MGLLSNIIFIPGALLAFSCAVGCAVIFVIGAVITATFKFITGERRLRVNDPDMAAAAAAAAERNRERA